MFHVSCSVRVPPRAGSVKIEMKGIFVGAKVVQGHDWEWGGQDGGIWQIHVFSPRKFVKKKKIYIRINNDFRQIRSSC